LLVTPLVGMSSLNPPTEATLLSTADECMPVS
jgi:hypothetical protein